MLEKYLQTIMLDSLLQNNYSFNLRMSSRVKFIYKKVFHASSLNIDSKHIK